MLGRPVLGRWALSEPGPFGGRPCDLSGCACSANPSVSFAHRVAAACGASGDALASTRKQQRSSRVRPRPGGRRFKSRRAGQRSSPVQVSVRATVGGGDEPLQPGPELLE